MDEHDQVVFAVACHVRHQRFARFGHVASAAAEGPLFKNLPAVRRHRLMRRGACIAGEILEQ